MGGNKQQSGFQRQYDRQAEARPVYAAQRPALEDIVEYHRVECLAEHVVHVP